MGGTSAVTIHERVHAGEALPSRTLRLREGRAMSRTMFLVIFGIDLFGHFLEPPALLAVLLFGQRRAAHALKVGHGEPELGEHFFMPDGFVVLQPLAGLGHGPLFFLADLFVFEQRCARRSRQDRRMAR
jgi:hypothetical protein